MLADPWCPSQHLVQTLPRVNLGACVSISTASSAVTASSPTSSDPGAIHHYRQLAPSNIAQDDPRPYTNLALHLRYCLLQVLDLPNLLSRKSRRSSSDISSFEELHELSESSSDVDASSSEV